MKDDKILISGIAYKVNKLIKKYGEVKEENTLLAKKIDNLTEQIDNQKREIKLLENKLKTIKLAKSLEDGPEKDQAKQRINELVREIDKCIGLLNT